MFPLFRRYEQSLRYGEGGLCGYMINGACRAWEA